MERMDEYHMAGRMLMDGGSLWRAGTMDGWCEGGLGQQRSDGGGCATIRERSERVEGPGEYVTGCFMRPFCLALHSLGPPSPALVVITWRWVGCRYMMQLG